MNLYMFFNQYIKLISYFETLSPFLVDPYFVTPSLPTVDVRGTAVGVGNAGSAAVY